MCPGCNDWAQTLVLAMKLTQAAIVRAVGENRHGVLATIMPGGFVHSVLVNPFWVEDAKAVGVFSRRKAQKISNLVNRPVATITLVRDTRYLSLMGSASLVGEPDRVADCFAAFYEKYQRFPAEASDRVLILLHVQRTVGALEAS
jgi:hypothetical protein